MNEGSIVVVSTGQCGTVVMKTQGDLWVLLANGNIWVGPNHRARIPQDQADMDACPLDVEREENKLLPREE